ncbi:carbon storage regulator [Blastopirellula marina]|uniref:Translational regulator CsrA n=1 Tax=Blastopirellula marina TaxID=124 RepID=A0A2S8G524_9BACT|nr:MULTISPECIES: carbon storage regulator [Pirellulaceae]PQO39371.1 carbon storage regulator [Blastopirellula marina]RCS55679.1 carbon storage regulator [Bremerella cremea]
MLVLTRKKGQTIKVDGPCTITVLKTTGATVRIGIEADKDTKVLRGEITIYEEPQDGEMTAEQGGEAA